MEGVNGGFVLGDHRFEPRDGVVSGAGRFEQRSKRIRGALPPTAFVGLVRESDCKREPGKSLRDGEFCGHGEPTFTVFDIVVDGSETVEMTGVVDDGPDGAIDGDESEEETFVVGVRAAGSDGPWRVIYRREWAENAALLEKVGAQTLSTQELASTGGKVFVGRMAVGFEYVVDAGSVDDVSWMTVVGVFGEDPAVMCIVDAELA